MDEYSLEAALEDGRLIDVSHLTLKKLNPYPTFVSAALWGLRELERCEDRLRSLLSNSELKRWLLRRRHGQFTCWYDSDRWLRHPLYLRVVINPDVEFERMVIFLLAGECLDFRSPRPTDGGSFFVM